MIELRLWRRHVVCCERNVGACTYSVRWGRVGVYRSCDTDTRKLTARLGADGCFGLAGLTEGACRGFERVAKAFKGLAERG